MAYNYAPYYQPPQPQPPTQIANGGFIPIPNEQSAKNYPIAHGTSLTFKDENAPYVYTKTLGFSQMDVPTFEKYRLIRETEGPSESRASNSTPKPRKDEIGPIKEQIEALQRDVDELKRFVGGDSDVE